MLLEVTHQGPLLKSNGADFAKIGVPRLWELAQRRAARDKARAPARAAPQLRCSRLFPAPPDLDPPQCRPRWCATRPASRPAAPRRSSAPGPRRCAPARDADSPAACCPGAAPARRDRASRARAEPPPPSSPAQARASSGLKVLAYKVTLKTPSGDQVIE